MDQLKACLLCLVMASLFNIMGRVSASKAEYDLVTALLSNYSTDVRPVKNSSEKVVVRVGLALNQIIDMDERNQILTLKVWMRLSWRDDHITWNETEYDGISAIRITASKIWRPDITLYSDVSESDTHSGMMYPAIYSSSGNVDWNFPAVLRTACRIQVQYVPWDQQACLLKFGSWSYDGGSLDVTNKSAKGDVGNFIKNGEWKLIGVPLKRHNIKYACCVNPYPDVSFWVVIRRKPLYYVFNLLMPCVFVVATTILVFYLPPESGEKISLGMTGLLALTVFLLLVAETLPPQSDSIPLIGSYFAATIVLLSMSTSLTVVVLNVFQRGAFGNEVPQILRTLVLNYLAKLMFLRQTVKKNITVKPSRKATVKNAINDVGEEIKIKDPENEEQDTKNFTIVSYDLKNDSKNNTNILTDIRDSVGELRSLKMKQHELEGNKENWMLVAVVLDRFFLVIFVILTVVVSLSILLTYPDYNEFDLNSVMDGEA